MNFIMKERVRWEDITPKATPFQDECTFLAVPRHHRLGRRRSIDDWQNILANPIYN